MAVVLPVRNPSHQPGDPDSDRDQTDPSGTDAGASERFWTAIVGARDLLAGTVDAVDPDTSAEDLLEIVQDYRACLAELVAVLPVPDVSDDV
jgi:hypothetical protein